MDIPYRMVTKMAAERQGQIVQAEEFLAQVNFEDHTWKTFNIKPKS
jgi:hypothetical protein